jgi:VanZ family protein
MTTQRIGKPRRPLGDRSLKIAFAVYTTVLLTATHWPQEAGLPPIPASDKIQHFIAYFLWTGLLLLATRTDTLRATGIVTGLGVVLAAVDEVTQGIPGLNRSPDFLDWIADAIGALTAATAWTVYRVIHAGRAG